MNVRRVRVATIGVEKLCVVHIERLSRSLSSINCACAFLHSYLRPLRLYHIFPHHLINGTISERVIGHNVFLLYSFRL